MDANPSPGWTLADLENYAMLIRVRERARHIKHLKARRDHERRAYRD